MLLVKDILVSDAIIEEHFVCNLQKCKGACCWQGDYGAPLEDSEVLLIRELLPAIKPYLTEQGRRKIEADGPDARYEEKDMTGTHLLDNGACVFMTTAVDGTAQCGIEKAWSDGAIPFRKPISCHLYPIRVKRIPEIAFEALNYDEWDICSAACALGKELKVPLYEFARDAIIRKYGEEFYMELDAIAHDLRSQLQ